MLLSAGLTWTLVDTGPPSRGLLTSGRRGGAAGGRRPADRRPAALASRFFACAALRPDWLVAVAPPGPSVRVRRAADMAAAATFRTLDLPLLTLSALHPIQIDRW